MRLSVIVCVYNTKKEYLDCALRSIANQSEGNIQICVVDDGSSLDYSDLVEKYGVKYVKTDNNGIFSARLTGIGIADGDYIAFHDSDDTVSFDYYRPMLDAAMKKNADIVVNDWAFHTDKARYFCKSDFTISTDIDRTAPNILPLLFEKRGAEHSAFVLWNKIYKSDIMKSVRDTLLAYEPPLDRLMYSEDALMSFFTYKSARRIVGVHTGYYFYRVHSSQSVNVISPDKLRSQIKDMSATLDIMERELSDLPDAEKMLCNLNAWRALMARSHYSHAKAKGYTDLYPYIREQYKVKKLKKATLRDGVVYMKNELLAENFEELDKTISDAVSRCSVKVWQKPCDRYTEKTLERYIKAGADIKFDERSPDVIIPAPEISTRNKIIHNFIFYSVASVIFPKGSRIREFLKERF